MMRHVKSSRLIRGILAWGIGLFLAFNGFAEDAVPVPVYPAESAELVYVLPQFTEFESISDSEMRFFRKTLQRAHDAKAKAVILEMDTPGGSVETAIKYLSIMEKSSIPIIVYLNPNGISAGMIIALGADRIAISPNGIIGDAMPLEMGLSGTRPIADKPEKEKVKKEDPPPAAVKDQQPPPADRQSTDQLLREIRKLKENIQDEDPEIKKLADQKFLTVFYKILQVLAEKNQRPAAVIRAMADPYQKLSLEKDGFLHDKTSPLTLSAKEAKQLHVVDYIAKNRSELLHQLNLDNATIEIITRTPTEQIGSFLATPAIAGLLLVLGLIGIFIEIKTPGFGVPGILGILALTLFFLGHIASGTSDWGPIVVFFVGLILLALEIFVIPGFGLVGVLGLGCILLSFFWAFGFSNIETALQVVTSALILAITVMILLALYVLPKTPLFRKVSLKTEISTQEGFAANSADAKLIGQNAIAVTPLRPSGTIQLNGKRFDATSLDEFINPGECVIVTQVNGFQLTVRRYEAKEA